MIAASSLEMAQYRLANHYIGKLRQIDVAIQVNRENSSYWFQLIEQDWTQIKSWQQWSVLHSKKICRAPNFAWSSLQKDMNISLFVKVRWID